MHETITRRLEWVGHDLSLQLEIGRLESLGVDCDEIQEQRKAALNDYETLRKFRPSFRHIYGGQLVQALIQLKRSLPASQLEFTFKQSGGTNELYLL